MSLLPGSSGSVDERIANSLYENYYHHNRREPTGANLKFT